MSSDDMTDSSPPVVSTKKGRKRGAKKWAETETDALLDLLDKVLPTGPKLWEKVAQDHVANGSLAIRTAEACKKRFEKLARQDGSTGNKEIPRQVQRAKDIQDCIERIILANNLQANDIRAEDIQAEDIQECTDREEPATKKGRKWGSKKWGETETDALLNLVHKVLPTGPKLWEKVAQDHRANCSLASRTAEACKKRFEKLARQDGSTGNKEIPRQVQRAKDIQDCIEHIKDIPANDLQANDIRAEDVQECIDREEPATKKRKQATVADAISLLAKRQLESSKIMAEALANLSKGGNKVRYKEMEDRLDKVESRLDTMQSKLDTLGLVESKLDTILECLKK